MSVPLTHALLNPAKHFAVESNVVLMLPNSVAGFKYHSSCKILNKVEEYYPRRPPIQRGIRKWIKSRFDFRKVRT